MDQLRRTRERFLAGEIHAVLDAATATTDGDAGAMPRPDIASSWRRSQLVGVQPESEDLPYLPDAPTPRRLITAAAPVIDALAAELADTTGTILLADTDVRILDRRVGTHSWLHNLDRHNVAPGFVFAEEYAGTNGLGCAIEEARLFQVSGAEHFRESLQSFVCIAAPIRHPTRNRIEGVLNLTCSLDDFSPFARSVLHRAVLDIEQRLLEQGSVAERMLLNGFMARAKRTSRPLVAVGADVFICNPAASGLLDRADRELLWYWASPALTHREAVSERIDLADGRTVHAHAARISDGPRVLGALIELNPADLREPAAPPPKLDDTVGHCVSGRSTVAAALRSAIARAGASRRAVLISGELGSGRRRIARTILNHRAPGRPPAFVNAGDSGWVAAATAAIAMRLPLLLRHAHNLGSADVRALLGMLERAERYDVPVVATTDSLGAELVGVFASALAVPPLRARSQDIADLVCELLPKVSPDRQLDVHPSALRALQQHTWPGNVRELQLTLSLAAQACIGRQILPRHLPDVIQQPYAALSPIERAEREAILAALAEADGNKQAAASALGFARSTLYRKMRVLKIDESPGF